MEGDPLHGLQTDIERSCRYHARREAFFDLCHKLTMGVSLLAGSSAFAAFFGENSIVASPSVGKFASALVAILTTINLIVGFSHKARDHQLLSRRFKELAVKIVEQRIAGKINVDDLERQYLLIEVDERPIYRALDASCRNEVVRAMYDDADEIWKNSIPLKRRHKVFMHFARFSDNDFRPRGEAKLNQQIVQGAGAP